MVSSNFSFARSFSLSLSLSFSLSLFLSSFHLPLYFSFSRICISFTTPSAFKSKRGTSSCTLTRLRVRALLISSARYRWKWEIGKTRKREMCARCEKTVKRKKKLTEEKGKRMKHLARVEGVPDPPPPPVYRSSGSHDKCVRQIFFFSLSLSLDSVIAYTQWKKEAAQWSTWSK